MLKFKTYLIFSATVVLLIIKIFLEIIIVLLACSRNG